MIIASYLGYDFVDAAKIVKFDEKGRFMEELTDKAIKKELANHEKAVIPGFYGSKIDGSVKTFSRGGSDITGSIIARAVGADMYENWTDVSGFLMADPRICLLYTSSAGTRCPGGFGAAVRNIYKGKLF